MNGRRKSSWKWFVFFAKCHSRLLCVSSDWMHCYDQARNHSVQEKNKYIFLLSVCGLSSIATALFSMDGHRLNGSNGAYVMCVDVHHTSQPTFHSFKIRCALQYIYAKAYQVFMKTVINDAVLTLLVNIIQPARKYKEQIKTTSQMLRCVIVNKH